MCQHRICSDRPFNGLGSGVIVTAKRQGIEFVKMEASLEAKGGSSLGHFFACGGYGAQKAH